MTGLIMGHFCLDHIPFADRCRIAAEAGFAGISVMLGEIHRLFAERGEGFVLDTLAAHRLVVDHIEYVRLPGFATPAERAARDAGYLALARTLGARAIHAVAMDRDASLAEVATAFAELIDHAEDVPCAIEFVPHLTATPDLASVIEVRERIGRDEAWLVLDSFHFFRCGAPWAALESLPTGAILTVQLNDGWLPPRSDDYGWEARGGRLLPGTGDFDLPRFIAAVDRVRLPAPLTVEVMSDALDASHPLAALRAMVETTRRFV